MKRLYYIISTTAFLAAAYLVLRFATVVDGGGFGLFPDAWHFLDPLRLMAMEGSSRNVTIATHALLTIALVWLSINRARDAGWSSWTGLIMIVPVVRLFLFAALSVVPTAGHPSTLNPPASRWLDRVLPKSRLGNAIAAIALTITLILPLGFLNVRLLEDYGLALFIGLPFVMGASSAFLYSHHQPRRWVESISIALLTTTVALAAIFLFAMEGLLCIVMGAPIVYPIAITGALVGHALARRTEGGLSTMTMLVLLAPGLMAFEHTNPTNEPLFMVVTSVSVNAPPQTVWDKLVAFSRMNEPDDLLFLAGISYPIEARIEGTGVGACRFCWFNTGPFVEPITVWDEPRLLAFDVAEDPPPMTELSIYDHIDAPHIDGFFRSRRGQFKLEVKPDGSTALEGTTWYTHSIWPTWYWKLWSDAILHRIHGRVLEHIKADAERQGA